MIDHVRTIASAAIMLTAFNALPAIAEDGQVGILAGGLRVPVDFWWGCVDDPASDPDSTSNGIYMCQDSEGWVVFCAGDPSDDACYLFPPDEHPGSGGGFGAFTSTNGQLQLAR